MLPWRMPKITRCADYEAIAFDPLRMRVSNLTLAKLRKPYETLLRIRYSPMKDASAYLICRYVQYIYT
jgi:hypothetical protein